MTESRLPSQARHATTAEVRSAAANVIGTEQPCHVLVRIWRYDHRRPAELGPLQLAIHNTVLCSEMGVHFSPCGRMVAACAAVEVRPRSVAGSCRILL